MIAFWIPLVPFSSFKYLGIVMLESEVNWVAVIRNLWRAWQKWEQLTRVFGIDGEDSQTLGRIYVAMVQALFCMFWRCG